MSKILLVAFIALILVASFGIWLAFGLYPRSGYQFSSDLVLNIVAEFFGIALGIAGPLVIASWLIRKRLNLLARPIVELVARLRIEKKISRESARSCVMCAVTLISEDQLKKGISLQVVSKERNCDVCDLKIQIRDDKTCEYCGLEDHVWNLSKELLDTSPT